MVVFEDPNANLDFCQMISSSLDCFLINFLQPNVARQQYNSYWIMKIQAHNEVTPTVWVLPSTVEFIHQKLSKAVNRHPAPFICIWTLRLQFLQHLLHLQIYLKKEISASTCPLFGKNFYIARCNEKQKKVQFMLYKIIQLLGNLFVCQKKLFLRCQLLL